MYNNGNVCDQKMGIGVGIVLLTSVELKIYCLLYIYIRRSQIVVTASDLNCHIGYVLRARLSLSSPSFSIFIFRKIQQSVSANSKRQEKWRIKMLPRAPMT